MGHDFFPAVGDALAVHSISAPDGASERALLANYAPNLPEAQLSQLVDLFAGCVEVSLTYTVSKAFSLNWTRTNFRPNN